MYCCEQILETAPHKTASVFLKKAQVEILSLQEYSLSQISRIPGHWSNE